MNESNTGLRANALRSGYGNREVLRGADLALLPGERLALIGPNGAGKTTLVRALLGFIAPASGEVSLDGRSLAGLARTEIARSIACVPQNADMPFPFTVREVVAMGRYPHRGRFAPDTAEDRRIAAHAMERAGLGSLADRHVTELSGGERQLVAIARALAQSPRYLVLDEPTANLDIAHALRIFGILASLASEGVGGLAADAAAAAGDDGHATLEPEVHPTPATGS